MTKTKVPFLDLEAHHSPLRAEFDEAIRAVIDQNAFAGGPVVSEFEKEFAAYVGAPLALQCLSCISYTIGPIASPGLFRDKPRVSAGSAANAAFGQPGRTVLHCYAQK